MKVSSSGDPRRESYGRIIDRKIKDRKLTVDSSQFTADRLTAAAKR